MNEKLLESHCIHSNEWRPGQRTCLKCHAANQRRSRERQEEKFRRAWELLRMSREMIHGEYCSGPLEDGPHWQHDACNELNDFLTKNPEPRGKRC